MASLNIEILNPKAKKLLQNLADLQLIVISENPTSPFIAAVKKIRSKKVQLTMADITKEVESVRAKRNDK